VACVHPAGVKAGMRCGSGALMTYVAGPGDMAAPGHGRTGVAGPEGMTEARGLALPGQQGCGGAGLQCLGLQSRRECSRPLMTRDGEIGFGKPSSRLCRAS